MNEQDDDGFFRRLSDSRAGVLVLLFGVTGCLGLPLLIASRRFTRREKWCWGLLNTAYTLGLIAAVVALLVHVYRLIARI